MNTSRYFPPLAVFLLLAIEAPLLGGDAPTTRPASEIDGQPQAKQIAVLDHAGGSLVRMSGKGHRVLTSDGASVQVWDLDTFKAIGAPLKAPDAAIVTADISFDGEEVMFATKSDANVFDLSGKTLLHFSEKCSITSARFNPATHEVAIGSDDKFIRIFDSRTGEKTRSFKHDGVASCVVFGPDGKEVLGIHDGLPYIHRVADGNAREIDFGDDDAARTQDSAQYSANGESIVLATTKGFRVYERSTLKLICRCEDPNSYRLSSGWTDAVGISSDGKRVYTVANDFTRVWDVRLAKPVTDPLPNGFKGPGHRPGAAFSNEGIFGLTGSPGVQGLWNLTEGKGTLLAGFGSTLQSAIAFSADGKLVATGDPIRRVTVIWSVPRNADRQ